MGTNEQIIRNFVSAWSRLNIEELTDFFTEDGIYHNMMLDPVQGRDNIREFIKGFAGNWADPAWELLNIAVNGRTVFTERVDRMAVGGKQVALPVCGVFELRDGKIAAWRDYFDLPTYMNAVG